MQPLPLPRLLLRRVLLPGLEELEHLCQLHAAGIVRVQVVEEHFDLVVCKDVIVNAHNWSEMSHHLAPINLRSRQVAAPRFLMKNATFSSVCRDV